MKANKYSIKKVAEEREDVGPDAEQFDAALNKLLEAPRVGDNS